MAYDKRWSYSGWYHVKVVSAGMNIDKALSIFKRKCKESGHIEEYRDRQEYKKPSLKKREKRNAAAKRRIQLELENNL